MAQLSFTTLRSVRNLKHFFGGNTKQTQKAETLPLRLLVDEIYITIQTSTEVTTNSCSNSLAKSMDFYETFKYYITLLEHGNVQINKKERLLAKFYMGYYYQQVAQFYKDDEKV